MKAFSLFIGLFFSVITAPSLAGDKSEPAVSKDNSPAIPVSDPPAAAPPIEEEEEGGEKTTTRAVPEGWIPNYRFPTKKESDLFSLNVGGNLFWPQASLNVLVANRVSVGVMPFYFDYKFEGTQSKHTGALLTVSAYSEADLQGLWVLFGVGASQSKSAFLDGRAAGTQPALILAATVGRRWKWGHFNTGISAGGMYFEQIHVSQFRYRLGVFYPAVIYDIGFSW